MQALRFSDRQSKSDCSRTIKNPVYLPFPPKALACKSGFGLVHLGVAFQQFITGGWQLALKEASSLLETHGNSTADCRTVCLRTLAGSDYCSRGQRKVSREVGRQANCCGHIGAWRQAVCLCRGHRILCSSAASAKRHKNQNEPGVRVSHILFGKACREADKLRQPLYRR